MTYSLSQNHPNPFNPSTTIEYTVPSRTHVQLEIYNILGELVATLIDEIKSAGTYRVTWHGRDRDDNPAASGIYMYRLITDDFTQSRKMVLMK
jgi:flagellar hook assembly protein FlgD